MSDKKAVRILLYCRMFLWVVALAATVYWIYWSFHLYTLGYMDEHVYAVAFRPIFAKGLLISAGAVVLSFIMRGVSDKIRNKKG